MDIRNGKLSDIEFKSDIERLQYFGSMGFIEDSTKMKIREFSEKNLCGMGERMERKVLSTGILHSMLENPSNVLVHLKPFIQGLDQYIRNNADWNDAYLHELMVNLNEWLHTSVEAIRTHQQISLEDMIDTQNHKEEEKAEVDEHIPIVQIIPDTPKWDRIRKLPLLTSRIDSKGCNWLILPNIKTNLETYKKGVIEVLNYIYQNLNQRLDGLKEVLNDDRLQKVEYERVKAESEELSVMMHSTYQVRILVDNYKPFKGNRHDPFREISPSFIVEISDSVVRVINQNTSSVLGNLPFITNVMDKHFLEGFLNHCDGREGSKVAYLSYVYRWVKEGYPQATVPHFKLQNTADEDIDGQTKKETPKEIGCWLMAKDISQHDKPLSEYNGDWLLIPELTEGIEVDTESYIRSVIEVLNYIHNILKVKLEDKDANPDYLNSIENMADSVAKVKDLVWNYNPFRGNSNVKDSSINPYFTISIPSSYIQIISCDTMSVMGDLTRLCKINDKAIINDYFGFLNNVEATNSLDVWVLYLDKEIKDITVNENKVPNFKLDPFLG